MVLDDTWESVARGGPLVSREHGVGYSETHPSRMRDNCWMRSPAFNLNMVLAASLSSWQRRLSVQQQRLSLWHRRLLKDK